MKDVKMVSSCVLVVLILVGASMFFPFLGPFLKDYKGEYFEVSIYKAELADQSKDTIELFPWQYQNTEQETLLKEEDVEEIKAHITELFSMEGIETDTDFSELKNYISTSGDLRYRYIKDYPFSRQNVSYTLDVAYDEKREKFVFFHYSIVTEFDREGLIEGEKKLKDMLFFLPDEDSFLYAGEMDEQWMLRIVESMPENTLIPYFLDVLEYTGEKEDLKKNALVSGGVYRKGNELLVEIKSNAMTLFLFWNPKTEEFDGFSMQIEE